MDLEAQRGTWSMWAASETGDGLGLRLTVRRRGNGQYRDAGGYPGLQTRIVDLSGWRWLPIRIEEARRGIRSHVGEDLWCVVLEITVAQSEEAHEGPNVFITCTSSAGAWALAYTFGFRPHTLPGPVFERAPCPCSDGQKPSEA